MSEKRRRFELQALPHLDAAHNLARWLARSPADADDIVQEAMLRAFRAWDGLRGEVKPWLLAIVRNCAHDHRQGARRHAHDRLGEDDPLPASEPDPESRAAASDLGRKLAP